MDMVVCTQHEMIDGPALLVSGTAPASERRHGLPPPSEIIEPRRLWLPLVRRSRSPLRTSCCDEDGVGTAEVIEGGREPATEP